MDEDEAKSIASGWIRRLEASFLAKVSDEDDNTIHGDHFYHRHHQDGSVSSSYSHDDLQRKHLELEKTSSDEKIRHEATRLPREKELFSEEVDISKIELNPHESSTKTPKNNGNASRSPRINLEDLREKRLLRFENLKDSRTKSHGENPKYLSPKGSFEQDMLQCEANSLTNGDNSLRKCRWNSKPCNYGTTSVMDDEDDKLRLELWGLRSAVESGQLDLNSYLGPMYPGSKNFHVGHHSEKEVKKDSCCDASSVSQECSGSRDANFNLDKMLHNPATESTAYAMKQNDLWKTENESSNKNLARRSTPSSQNDVNEVDARSLGDTINTKEDFTRFSVTKASTVSSYGKGAAPWPQIEGKLYNGFETSDSESSLSVPSLYHGNKSGATHYKSNITGPKKVKSARGKQKILDELSTFLDSERNSKRSVKESTQKPPKNSEESRIPGLPGNILSNSMQLLSKELVCSRNPDFFPKTEANVSAAASEDFVASDLQYRKLDTPITTSVSNYGNSKLLSSELAEEDYHEDSSIGDKHPSSGTLMAKVCKTCQEVNSKAANWCIECGTALIEVAPVILTSEQQSRYEMQCQETKNLIADTLKSNKQLKNGSTTMSKKERELYQDVLQLTKEVEKNSLTGFSNESLRSNLSDYKRRWQKSSIAWSSFEPQELSKPSSVGKLNGKEKEMVRKIKKSGDNFRSRSSSDLLASEGIHKKHGKNGHSKHGGRRRTTSANYHSVNDYDLRNQVPINLELSNQEKITHKDELRPASAKSNSKSQRVKPHKKRPSSGKPRTSSQSSSPELFSPGKGKLDGRERRNDVHVPLLNLDDLGSYDRIVTLIRSQPDCEPVPYLYLPEEIILQIFFYLPIKDKVSCSEVCWQFYRIAMDESLWRTIVIRKNKSISDTWLESIGDRHPTSLTISQCSGNDVTSNGLRSLFRKCSKTLEEVDFSGCGGGELIGESILLHIAARCSGVVSVDVSWTNVSDNGVEALADNLTRLECLCLNGCQAISDKTLTCVADKHGESLRIFEVFGCFNITPASLQAFANKCVHLQTLNIGQCHKMTDSAIGKLVSHLPELENLDLRGCKQARDTAVKKVVRHCPHLTSLVLANCPLITDVALSEISTNLPAIRSLDICGCANITDAGVRALAQCCHKLELLDLSSTGNSVTSKSVISLGNYCSQSLRVLKLSFCADVTVHTVNQLAKKCKKLRLLHLYGCKRIKEHDKLNKINPLLVIEK